MSENINEDIKRKGKSKIKNLSLEDRFNAEFKHLKLRIKKLEKIILDGKIDHGLITESNTKKNKG